MIVFSQIVLLVIKYNIKNNKEYLRNIKKFPNSLLIVYLIPVSGRESIQIFCNIYSDGSSGVVHLISLFLKRFTTGPSVNVVVLLGIVFRRRGPKRNTL